MRFFPAVALACLIASPAAAYHRKPHPEPSLPEAIAGAVQRLVGGVASAAASLGTPDAPTHSRQPRGHGGTVFATYYGGSDGFCGKRTASGERYDCDALTAAYPDRRMMGQTLNVCGPAGCAGLRINDVGPTKIYGAGIDLSMAAAKTICGALKSCFVTIRQD